MKKWVLLCGLTLLFSLAASAQDNPKVEAFGGYSYVHTNDQGASANFNGGSGSVSLNLNNWLGGVADFGGYHTSTNGADATVVTYLFGPKIAFRRSDRITPFAQVLFGGAHASAGAFGSANAFAMTLGGGVDVNATKHIAVRVIQAEYLMTKFQDGGSDRQDSARISAGVVFRF
ncbi:MAG: outer membrane beta-barrel protein [Candidatus Acidiferrales bacterium]